MEFLNFMCLKDDNSMTNISKNISILIIFLLVLYSLSACKRSPRYFNVDKVEMYQVRFEDSALQHGRYFAVRLTLKDDDQMTNGDPYGGGAKVKIDSIIVCDSSGTDITNKLIGINSYRDLPLGALYFGDYHLGRYDIGYFACVADSNLSDLKRTVNETKGFIYPQTYNSKSHTQAISRLYRVEDGKSLPKSIHIMAGLGTQHITFTVNDTPKLMKLKSIAPLDKDDSLY